MGYDRALANLGHKVSGPNGRKHPAPTPHRASTEAGRTTTWKEYLQSHMDVLAGADLEVLTWRGLVTYYLLFFIEAGSRRVRLGGITRHPESWWMQQVARNASVLDSGDLKGCRCLRHDRDQKFSREFRDTLAVGGVKCLPLPARSPNWTAHAERWVHSCKEECPSKLILFGENSLRRVMSEFREHRHQERNHPRKDNVLLFPVSGPHERNPPRAIQYRERLGGLLKCYGRAA